MNLSIVTTMYFSAPYVREFYTRMRAVAEQLTDDYEILFVNDGSPDRSLEIVLSLYERDPRVRVVDLSRNFGHDKAIMTGLAHARGANVFLIDCDLEEEPEWLRAFDSEFKRSGADVVYGVQQMRKGKFFERLTGGLFYRLFNLLSTYPVPVDTTTARLMSQRYVTSLVAHKDQAIFVDGLWAITGFQQVPLVVEKRSKGTSTYTLSRKVSLFVNAVVSFSGRPLVFIFYLGCGIVVVSGLAALYLVGRKVFLGDFDLGWPSLMLSIWALGGLTIFCLGVIGIYLSRVFMETKQRPYTVIRRVYERTGENEVTVR